MLSSQGLVELRGAASSEQRTTLTEQRQPCKSKQDFALTDPSANRENCCKAKPGLSFHQLLVFFQTPVSDRDFPPSQFSFIQTIQIFKERGCIGSSLKTRYFEPDCGGFLWIYNRHAVWWLPWCPNPMFPGCKST